MSTRFLNYMFNPSSVAVIGASDRPHSVGGVVMRNLLVGGISGPIMPVNPKHKAIAAVMAYPDVKALPEVPDLAVICTPPPSVPGIIRNLGELGTRAAVVLTAGLENQKDQSGASLQDSMLAAARDYGTRILGPNCLGLMNPAAGLNASFAHALAAPGRVAFVTQSGALSTAVLDYARSNEIGLSSFVSLGNGVDVDFGDVLDYLGADPSTGAILLYIESIKDAPKFMSAARAATMAKPVLAVKSGRVPEGARAAMSHTGALAGSDDVFETALKRAGILRVQTIPELFDAVETLALAKFNAGNRLAILTNGGGPAVMATDALVLRGGRLATLGEDTLAKLDSVLPANWSHANPVDIIGDAPPQRYVDALKTLLECPECDAILFIQAPTAIVASSDVASAMIPVLKTSSKPVLSSFLGSDAVAQARRIFVESGIPTYTGPEDAVDAFLQITRYQESQQIRLQTPASVCEEFAPEISTVRSLINGAMAEGRYQLGEAEAKAILAGFGIPVVQTRIAKNTAEAETLAEEIGFPVALKIMSPDLIHKSDVGGVVLDLENPDQLRRAADSMMKRLEQLLPTARLTGFTVQQMARRPGAHELIVGVATDPIFGPVILFGQGGTAVEVIKDRAIALPPLNETLARELIGRTRVAKLLAGYRGKPAANINAICAVLNRISQLLIENPEVVELDVNPLLASEKGVLALDARMRLAKPAVSGISRFAIRPYPRELEETISLGVETIKLRPVRPEDAVQYGTFLSLLKKDEQGINCLDMKESLLPVMAARHTQIDYNRQMAFVAIDPAGSILGIVRALTDSDNARASCSMAIVPSASDTDLGFIFLKKIAAYCRGRGTAELIGFVRKSDETLVRFVRDSGCKLTETADPEMLEGRMKLQEAGMEAQR